VFQGATESQLLNRLSGIARGSILKSLYNAPVKLVRLLSNLHCCHELTSTVQEMAWIWKNRQRGSGGVGVEIEIFISDRNCNDAVRLLLRTAISIDLTTNVLSSTTEP
jgi:hypothetical protein